MIGTRSRTLDLFLGTGHIIGQEKARKQMAVLFERQWQVVEGKFPKSGAALIGGRSGTGKTALARSMCELSGLPFAEVSATRFIETGYAGLYLQEMFIPLLESAAAMYDDRQEEPRGAVLLGAADPGDTPLFKRDAKELREITELAQTGVVLLDEFDKWMLRINHVTGQRDTAIQADLLKMIEGSVEYVSDNEDLVGIPFDTSRVLILCAGAFVTLQASVAKRLEKRQDDDVIWDLITQEDFVRYGLLPELAGRLSTHIFLRPLKTDHLETILRGENGVLDEYQQRFEAVGCRWSVSREGIRSIAEQAMLRETGARAVDHLMHRIFGEALYEAAVAEVPVEVQYHTMWPKARVVAL